MLSTLSRIAAELDKRNILWGVGGSLLLNQYGLDDDPKDMDLIVDVKDAARVDDILSWLGRKKPKAEKRTYSTKIFYEYDINGTEVDVMAGLMMNHESGTYSLVFDMDSISQFVQIRGINIPLASLEDWFILFQMMPGKEAKADRIEEYLRTHGIGKPFLIKRALEGNLPQRVKDRVQALTEGK